MRMTKEPHGKKCSVCETPFTVFAWQAGTKGRLKKVEICRSCAESKNVCQVCIYDLQYGLPVKVRDQVLRETGSAVAGGAVPQSMANRAWFSAQQERALEQGKNMVGDANELAHAKLSEMAQMEPKYERNLAKVCTFYARGECNRGVNCPFRHELPKDRNDPLAQKSNSKNRFFGSDDPVGNRMLARRKKVEENQKKVEENEGYDKARATLYLRFQGEPPYPELTEDTIRDKFYAFGEIVSVRIQSEKGQAFVEYTQPEAAELAIASMNKKGLLERQIFVAWARAPKRGDNAVTDSISGSKGELQMITIAPPPPPGGLTTKKPIPKFKTVKLAGVSSVPRPGGGPVRQVGKAAAKHEVSSKDVYYPSSDPARLGSKR